MATWTEALPLLGIGIGGLVLAGVLFAGGAMLSRRARGTGTKVAVGLLLAAAEIPLVIYAGLFVLIGIAAVGCAPDAYECPI